LYHDYYNTPEFKELLRQFEQAEQEGRIAAISPDDLTDVAEYYHTMGEKDHALRIIDEAIECYPGAVGPLVFRAREALMQGGDCQTARFYAEQIDDKADLDYYYLQAEIMIVENRVEEADKYLVEKYDEVDDEELQDYVLDVATIFADYELWDLAEVWAKEYDDKEADDYLELQARLKIVFDDSAAAEQIVNRLIDRNPFHAGYWVLLAKAQFYGHKLEDCAASCDYALAINPNDQDALLVKANVLFRRGNIEDAAVLFARYMRNNGEDVPGDAELKDCLKRFFNE